MRLIWFVKFLSSIVLICIDCYFVLFYLFYLKLIVYNFVFEMLSKDVFLKIYGNIVYEFNG